MNKKQLHRSLHSTIKKLICAKKTATITAMKLSATKAQCTIMAKIAQDCRKESNLAHQKAESEVNAIRDEMKIAKALCDNAVSEAHDKVIAKQVFLSTRQRQHAKELLITPHLRVKCDIGSVCRCVDKEFNKTANYAKGNGDAFDDWMRRYHPGELMMPVIHTLGGD
jgi:hypothetical protein